MDGFCVLIRTNAGSTRYRLKEEETWDLGEAEFLASRLVEQPGCQYVTLGNGGDSVHEFRMWSPNADFNRWSTYSNGEHRWAQWYVDAEINGRRWRYRPVADLANYGDTVEIVLGLTEANFPEISKIWTGASDGSEEFETIIVNE